MYPKTITIKSVASRHLSGVIREGCSVAELKNRSLLFPISSETGICQTFITTQLDKTL